MQLYSNEINGTAEVGFVIGGTSISPESESFFKGAEEGIQELFPGRPISLFLLDNTLKKL